MMSQIEKQAKILDTNMILQMEKLLLMPLIHAPRSQALVIFIQYMIGFHFKILRSFYDSAKRQLELWSDHRCVSASIEYIRPTESW